MTDTKQYIKGNWKQLLIALAFIVLVLVGFNQYLGILFKVELLDAYANPCETCMEKEQAICYKRIPIDFEKIKIEEIKNPLIINQT